MLDDPRIAVIDIATHPDVRVDLMRRAFAAGKHVLSQKPFVEDLATGEMLVAEAERREREARRQPEWPLGAPFGLSA